MQKTADDAIAAAEAKLDPTFPSLKARFVAEGGSSDYAEVIARNVREMAGLELPHWSREPLQLPDPLVPSERSFKMDDAGEVLRWAHQEEFRVWLLSAAEAMTRVFKHDFPQISKVCGIFLRHGNSWQVGIFFVSDLSPLTAGAEGVLPCQVPPHRAPPQRGRQGQGRGGPSPGGKGEGPRVGQEAEGGGRGEAVIHG